MKIPLAYRYGKLLVLVGAMLAPTDAALMSQVSDSVPSVTLPISTRLTVALDDSLNSTTARSGQEFSLVLTEPLTDPWGTEVAPAGTPATGHVLSVTKAGWVARQASILFTVRGIRIGGRTYPIRTNSMNIEGGRDGWITPQEVNIRAGRTFLFTLVVPVTLPVTD